MYYTGVDPRTMQPVYVPKSPHEKALQRALIQYRDPKNRDLVLEALRRAGRMDLVGYGPKCLLRPQGEGGGTRADVRAKAQSKPNDSGKAPSKARPSGPGKARPKPKPSTGKTSSQGGGRSGKSAGERRPGKSKGTRRH